MRPIFSIMIVLAGVSGVLALTETLHAGGDPERIDFYMALSKADPADRFGALASYLERYPDAGRSDQVRAHLLALGVSGEGEGASIQRSKNARQAISREGQKFVHGDPADSERLLLTSEAYSRFGVLGEAALEQAKTGLASMELMSRPSGISLSEWPDYRAQRIARAQYVLALAEHHAGNLPAADEAYLKAAEQLADDSRFRKDFGELLSATGKSGLPPIDPERAERAAYLEVLSAETTVDRIKAAENYVQKFPDGSSLLSVQFRLVKAYLENSTTAPEGTRLAATIARDQSDQPEVLSGLAFTLAEADAAPKDAVAYGRSAAAILSDRVRDPATPASDLPRLHTQLLLVKDALGWAQYRAGSHDDALTTLRDAVDSGYPGVKYHYGLALASVGRAYDAVSSLVAAITGGVPEARPALDRLIRDNPSIKPHAEEQLKKADRNLEREERLLERNWEAPDFTLVSLAGDEVSLSSLEGEVVVLDFWASWCGPCKKEMPEIQKLVEEYAGRDVRFLGVNADRDPWLVRPFLETYGLDLEVLFLGTEGETWETLQSSYKISSIPSLFVIDRAGRVRYQEEGFDGNGYAFGKRMRLRLDKLLGES